MSDDILTTLKEYAETPQDAGPNWSCLVMGSDLAKAVSEIERLKAERDRLKCDVFRVKQWEDTCADHLTARYGTCYSFYGHFDVHWDNGEHQMNFAELSVYGIYVCKEEVDA